MLRPQDRRLFLDLLRPPIAEDGSSYRLDLALGTTYSLDLIALLAAPVAMAFSDWQDQHGRPAADPLSLLKAVREYADRICLFCQAGKIYVPKAYQPLLVNLEGSIVQAVAPAGGSFHPKLWVLRFAHPHDASDVTYRVLCLSRNLTFDRSWDVLLSLEGRLTQRANAIARNHPLGEFIESLPSMATPQLSSTWSARLEQISREVRRVDFETPEPFEDLRFHPLGIPGHKRNPIPEGASRLLVVSPFVDDSCLRDLAQRGSPLQLVSRPESLELVSSETLGLCSDVWTLDETSEFDSGDQEQSDDETPMGAAGSTPLVGLHAKLYVADYGWNSSVWMGSANATATAFNRNVEFLVELTGKRAKCGVEVILGKRNEAGPRKAGCLADMLQPFRSHDAVSDERLAALEFERYVDRYARLLIAANPAARCEAREDRTGFQIVLEAVHAIPTPASGTTLLCRPVSLPDFQAQPIVDSAPSWCRFETVSFEAVTSFFMFELNSAENRFTRRFVLNLPLVNPPENRRERILRNLLDSPQKLLRFLLMLLQDQGASNLGELTSSPVEEKSRKNPYGILEGTLLESLLRALDREPFRIDQVAQLIEDLQQAEGDISLLPDRFQEIWQPIWAVRRRQLEIERRDANPPIIEDAP